MVGPTFCFCGMHQFGHVIGLPICFCDILTPFWTRHFGFAVRTPCCPGGWTAILICDLNNRHGGYVNGQPFCIWDLLYGRHFCHMVGLPFCFCDLQSLLCRVGNSLIRSLAHFLITHLLICSDPSLRSNKRLWVIHSDRAGQMSDFEQIAQVTHDKCDLLRSLMINEQMSKSLSCSQKTSNLQKIFWLKS